MDIFFASDNNYIQHLGVSIVSILYNAAPQDEFNFYILENNISNLNKEKIFSLKKIKSCNIEFLSIPNELFESCPQVSERITRATYFRYIIPKLKPDLQKAFYFDCDIVVLSSLSEFWNTNLGNTYCAYVEDTARRISLASAKRLGVNNYFNAGILLINISKWKEDNMCDILFKNTDALCKNNNITYADQDVLNYTFKDNVTWIDIKYNLQQSALYKPLFAKYSKMDIERAIKNPVIIHYSNHLKPWNSYKQNKFFDEYWKYYKLTEFWKESEENKYKELSKYYCEIKLFGFNIFTCSKINNGYEIKLFCMKTIIN